MNPSYRDMAKVVLKKRATPTKQDSDKITIKILKDSFIKSAYKGKFLNVLRLIIEWHELNIDDFSDTAKIAKEVLALNNGIKFYYKDLGSFTIPNLDQVYNLDSSSGQIISSHFAWAIKFENIFGMDIYFVPFVMPEDGFACTIFKHNATKLIPATSKDISRETLVNLVADYLESKIS